MKYKYKLAYSDYEIGENERLFSDMAKKGWMLCKMGSRFCKFKRSEPQELKYRIELINSEIFSSDRDMRLAAGGQLRPDICIRIAEGRRCA